MNPLHLVLSVCLCVCLCVCLSIPMFEMSRHDEISLYIHIGTILTLLPFYFLTQIYHSLLNSTILYSTWLYSTLLYSTLLYSTLPMLTFEPLVEISNLKMEIA